jgi:hypothetical protein
LTASDLFVIETTNTTPRSSTSGQVRSLSAPNRDHQQYRVRRTDIFDDLASIERQFRHFVRIIPRSGLIVSNIGRSCEAVLAQAWTPIREFGPVSWGSDLRRSGHFEVLWRGGL